MKKLLKNIFENSNSDDPVIAARAVLAAMALMAGFGFLVAMFIWNLPHVAALVALVYIIYCVTVSARPPV
jgi:uncharacterized membrane protein YgaE (UPF0421/DUF939 family)